MTYTSRHPRQDLGEQQLIERLCQFNYPNKPTISQCAHWREILDKLGYDLTLYVILFDRWLTGFHHEPNETFMAYCEQLATHADIERTTQHYGAVPALIRATEQRYGATFLFHRRENVCNMLGFSRSNLNRRLADGDPWMGWQFQFEEEKPLFFDNRAVWTRKDLDLQLNPEVDWNIGHGPDTVKHESIDRHGTYHAA